MENYFVLRHSVMSQSHILFLYINVRLHVAFSVYNVTVLLRLHVSNRCHKLAKRSVKEAKRLRVVGPDSQSIL